MKSFFLRTLSMAALLSLSLAVGAQSVHAVLIDSFDQDQAEVTDSSATAGGSTLPAETVLLGTELSSPERQIFVEVTGVNSGTRAIRAGIDSGAYSHSQEVGAFGYSTVTYSGFGVANLAANGEFGIVLQVIESDLGGEATFTLTDNGGNTGTHTVTIPQVVFGSPQSLFFLFTDLVPNVDPTQITQFVLEIDGRDTASLDVTVDFVATATPEPTSLLLIGSGLIGLAWIRRKQKITNA